MKQKTLSEKTHKEFMKFQTPTYNFKHLRNLELRINKVQKQFIKEILEEIEFAQQDPFDGFDGQIFELISNIIKQKAGDDL